MSLLTRVNSIMNTTFEDGSVWVEYRTKKGLSYELDYNYCEGDEAKAQSDLMADANLQLKILDKPTLSVCSDYLGSLIESCRQSENEMWFEEFEDVPPYIDIEDIEDEVTKLGLEGYVETYSDDCAIVIYGGIITKFIF